MAKKSQREYVQLQLTCGSEEEAAEITGVLLGLRLVACAKRVVVETANWWQENIEQGSEVLLFMESAADLFDEVAAEVGQIHSYETFVLQSLPILDLSPAARAWMDETLAPHPKQRRK